jgi:chemotaxis signal transduction protein
MSESREVSHRAEELRRSFDRRFAEPLTVETLAMVDLLGVRFGDDAYAVRLSEVSGLFADRKIIPIPSSISALLGIAGLRGGLVAVYGLRALLGYPPTSDSPRWLMLAGSDIGLAFEHFEGYLRAPRSAISKSEGATSKASARETLQVESGSRSILQLSALIEAINERVASR